MAGYVCGRLCIHLVWNSRVAKWHVFGMHVVQQCRGGRREVIYMYVQLSAVTGHGGYFAVALTVGVALSLPGMKT